MFAAPLKLCCIRIFAAVFVLLLAAGPSSARTWYVKADGTGDVPTIQAGVDSAAPGDVVLVAPGNYTWANQGGGDPTFGMINIARGRDDFTLRSEGGPLVTTLNAQGQNRVIFIQGFNGITIEGFTIRGGVAPAANPSGGGLACHLSSDIIRDCRFINNTAQSGGGLWNGGVSQLRIENCEFRDNSAYIGGALYFVNSNTQQRIINCTIDRNSSDSHGGAIYAVNDKLRIEGTVFSRNTAGGSGGAIGARSIYPSTLLSCTITENISSDGGGIYLLDCPSLTIERSIIAYQGSGAAFVAYAGSVITLSCSDVFSNPGGSSLPAGSIDGGGNFSLNPMFCGTFGTQIYEINAASPCAENNHPDEIACGLIGARPVNCGQVPTEATSWGRLKSIYRE